MEDFVAAVKLYSNDKNWSQLVEYINASFETLIKNAGKIDSAIGALDPEQNTLGFLGLLLVKVNLPNYGDFELLFTQVQQFIEICSKDQLQFGIEKFRHVCYFITQCFVERKEPLRGIEMMTTAVKKAQQSPTQLTSLHAYLLQLCLLAKVFKPAIHFLDMDMTDIHKENGHYDSKMFLLYYYYGGMVYTAVKQFKKAVFFLEVAVTTPAISVSHIMLEAYKKFILVSILLHGKVQTLPKYTPTVVPRFLKPLSSPYQELGCAYATHDIDQLRGVANKHQQIFQRDNNVGLVKQVIASLYKRNIQRLTKTFLTLSLSDMATRVKLNNAKEAENYLLEMIEDGEIYATTDHRDGMVSFHENPEKYNAPIMLEKIDRQMRMCVQLDEQLQLMDRELSVNPQYVQRVVGMAQLDEAGKGDELMI